MLKVEGNIRKSYSIYKETVETPLTLKAYIDIANGFMKFIMQEVAEGNEVTLPANMGTLCVVGRKPPIRLTENGMRLLPPNWAATKILREKDPVAKAERKVVYHLNEHTGGVIYKVHWSKKNMAVTNKNLYSLVIARASGRAIWQLILEGKEYFRKTLYHGKSN
jgi:hypothetical protein